MASARQQQQPSQAPIVIGVSLLIAGFAFWKGWPGTVAIWLGVIVAAWIEPPVMLTGKKDATGYPTPAGPAEEKNLRRFAAWRELKWRLISPNADWLPGWPVLGSFIAAAFIGLALFCAPVAHDTMRFANAAAGFILVASIMGVRRRTLADDDVCPGARVDTLVDLVKSKPYLVAPALVAGTAAAIATIKFVPVWDPFSLGIAGPHTTAAVDPESFTSGLVDYGTKSPYLLAFAAAALGVLAVLAVPWTTTALEHWRIVVAARAEWRPRWLALKQDPAPWLVDRQKVGEATVDTFFATPGIGASAYFVMAPKIGPTIGAGSRIAVLDTPNEGPEGPVPGTKHPLRFEVVVWPMDGVANVSDPETAPDVVALVARCAFDWAADEGGYGRPVLLGLEALHAEGAETCVWKSSWAFPDGPDLMTMRTALLGSVRANFGHDVEVVIDSRNKVEANKAMFFGALTEDPPEDWLDPGNPPWPDRFEQVYTEDQWDSRWAQILKQGTHAPTVEHSTTVTAELADGTAIHQQAFVGRVGIDPAEFLNAGSEKKIATALQAAPFASVTGWPGAGDRPGERHPMAVIVRWASRPVPSSPQNLAPLSREAMRGSKHVATTWVASSHMNKAFDAGRLARPEVLGAKCLTAPSSRGHIWQIDLRLYGGVTLSDVRGAVPRLRSGLGVNWLRVTPHAEGCTIFAGAVPSDPKTLLAFPGRDMKRLVALDWEQAWLDAGVSGVGGLLPKLVATARLPRNEAVEVLDFVLPAGVDVASVKAAVPKLMSSTNNAFVEVRPGPDAQTIKLLVCPVNPLPERVAYDFEYADTVTTLPFATGIEGEPIGFDRGSSPHALVAGVTGGGKAQPLSSRIPVPVSERFPTGWATIGKLRRGDSVFAADGSATTVLALSDIVERPVHTVHFDTGETVECSPDHLWKVSTAAGRRVRTPRLTRARQARFDDRTARADRLRELAGQAQAGLLASLSDISTLSGVSLPVVCRLVPDHLAVDVVVPTGKKTDLLDVDAVVAHLLQVISDRGVVKLSGAEVTAEIVDRLPASSWMTVTEIADALVRSTSTRDQRHRVKHLARVSGAQRRTGGQAHQRQPAYPVDEVLVLLAEHFDHMAVRSDSGRQVRPLEEIVTAAEIASAATDHTGRRNFAVSIPGPIDGPAVELPVDPWVLGVWLGDGSSRHMEITQGATEACTDPETQRTDRQHILDGLAAAGVEAHLKPSDDNVISMLGMKPAMRSINVLENKHIPAVYLRSSAAQRLAVLQGLMDTDGTIAEGGGCELSLCDGRLATDALELIRSLGIKCAMTSGPATITEDDPDRPGEKRQRVTGTRWRMHFTTSAPVFRLPRKAGRVPTSTRNTRDQRYVTDVTVGDSVPMRCISVAHPEHLYLTGSFVPTHNSVLAQNFVYGALVNGYEVFILDPMKGAADYQFAKDRCVAFAENDIFEAAGILRSVYDKVIERKKMNAAAGVGSINDLAHPPPPILVLIDEFTSLMGKAMVPAKSDDPEAEAERLAVVAQNTARAQTGMFVGKIAREARSAGVVLALGTQQLSAKLLDSIPGVGTDLKTNLARTLLGKASYGDRSSALRAPDDAPRLEGAMPPGRGLWEPLTSSAMTIQTWFAPQDRFREELVKRVPALAPDQFLDMSSFVAPVIETDNEIIGDGPMPRSKRPAPVPDQEQVIDVGTIELSLDDLVALEDDPVEPSDGGGFSLEELEAVDVDAAPADDGSDLDWSASTSDAPPVPAADDLDWGSAGAAERPVVAAPAARAIRFPDTVTFLDVDGVIFPMAKPGPTWPDWEATVRDDEDGWVSPAQTAALTALGTEFVWLTSWTERARAFDDLLGPLPVLAPSGDEPVNGWWKIDAALTFLDEHPEFTNVVWVDDELDQDNGSGRTHREVIAEMLATLDIGHLLVCPDPDTGMAPEDIADIADWLGIDLPPGVEELLAAVEAETEAAPPAPAVEAETAPAPTEPTRGPEPARSPALVSAGSDDDFGPSAWAPPVVTDDNEFG